MAMNPLEESSCSLYKNCSSGCGAYNYTDSGAIYVGCPISPTIPQQPIAVSSSPTQPQDSLEDKVEQDSSNLPRTLLVVVIFQYF